jgi:hypothetical protein
MTNGSTEIARNPSTGSLPADGEGLRPVVQIVVGE